jgi:c(7)-type cytochrome triheme protein
MKTRLSAAVLLLAGLMLAGGDAVYGAQGDLVFEREGKAEGSGAFPPSVFPHWVHRTRYRCYVCHPAPFTMQQGANAITMDSIQQGQFCGACHNGKTAFAADFENCARCHKEPED